MSLYFRRRLALGPISLNFSKSGVGISAGIKGFHLGMSASRRAYVSASLPGTGLLARHYFRIPHHAIAGSNAVSVPHPVGEHSDHSFSYALGYASFWLLISAPIILLATVIVNAVK